MNPRVCPSHQSNKPPGRCQNCELALAQYEHKRERIATACLAGMIAGNQGGVRLTPNSTATDHAVLWADFLIESLENG